MAGLIAAAPHRAGLLIPSSNTLIEQEYYAVMPRAVSLHFGRLTLTQVNDEGIRRQDEDVAQQAALLATARVGVILFCQTAASFYMGHAFDAGLKSRIEQAAGVAALTAAGTVVAALQALGARRLALATPFVAAMNETCAAYLRGAGFEVVHAHGLEMTDNFAIATLSPQAVLDCARRADHPAADAIVMPGGNMPCLAAVETLERELGKPVVTTNQAGMWAILRHFGVSEPMPGCGRLLERNLAVAG